MTFTYKQFLINDTYFECHLDNHGKLLPMFIKARFESVDQIKARINKYWDEVQMWQHKRNVDISRSFDILKKTSGRNPVNESGEQDYEDFSAKVDAYFDNQLNENV